MPNVKGLRTARDLYARLPEGLAEPYGNTCLVTKVTPAVSISRAGTNETLATVTFPEGGGKHRVKATLRLIGSDVATPVNAFLKDYGQTKINWRTGVREWKPNDGAAVAPSSAPSAHLAPPSVVEARPQPVIVIAPEVIATTEVPKAPIKITLGGGVTVPTERVWEGAGRAPKIKRLTKTWSAVGEVLLPSTDVTTLEIAWTLRQAGRPSAVLITGPKGTAKTRLAEQFAFSKGVSFLKVDGASIQTAADWFGGFVQRPNGVWEWEWSDFSLAILRGSPCVILVDEINRPENERALNGLMGLLDWTATYRPLGAPQALTLPPGILVMATLNEGIEYVGTVEVDAAVRDRFPWGVRMDYSAENIEARILTQACPGLDAEVAKRLVRVAAGQRAKRDDDMSFPSHNVISTRTLIEIGSAVILAGADPVTAIWASLKSSFIKEDEPALTVLIEAQFGATPEVLDDKVPEDENLEALMSHLAE